MQRLAVVCALAIALASPAASDEPPQFTDATCPNATPIGRHLNDLSNATGVSSGDLMRVALQMVSAYQECADGYDRDAQRAAPFASRLYAHLALARSQQRVGNYYAAQHEYQDARASYDAALKSLVAMNAIAATATIADGSPERALLSKGAVFRQEIETAEAALPKTAPGASPSPVPSRPAPLEAPSPTPAAGPPQKR